MALWEDSRSLLCNKHTDREESQMVAQEQISEMDFLPLQVLDWQL